MFPFTFTLCICTHTLDNNIQRNDDPAAIPASTMHQP